MRALPLIVATALAAALTPTVSFAAPTTAPAAEDYSLARSTPVKDPIYPDFGFAETDALHYHLGLDWDGATLKGVTTVKVRAATSTSSLRFNLGDALKVSGITVGGKASTFTHSNRTLTINTGALAADSVSDVVISYAGKPAPVQMPSSRKGNLGWNVNRNGVVSTLQEPYGAYTWYPVNDHPSDKAYFDATITTKSSVMGVFNGVLTGKKSDGGKTIANWHLDKPAASYLTTIAIDNFRVDEQKMADGKTFYIWYTDQDKRWLSGWRQESKRAYDWLSAHAGPNHFASMGMVVVDTFSAMETQTMMTMGSRLMQGSASTLIAHEMAHQWFGDTVTTKTWRDTWLNEGWTEYMEEAFSGSLDPARSERACRNAVGQAGQAGNPKPGEFAMQNVYQCPIPAIAQVRADLGDAKFFELAAGWVHDHAFTSQERSTFEAYVQSKTGRDYRGVFSQWLDKVQPSSRW